MAYFINDDCSNCGTCEEECPDNCISEGDGKYVINAEACNSCGKCAEVCPSDAIAEA